MPDTSTLLFISDTPVPQNVVRAAGQHWQLRTGHPDDHIQPEDKLVVVKCDDACSNPTHLAEIVNELDASQAVGIHFCFYAQVVVD